MIWRFAHPVRGLVAAWLVAMLATAILGFGVGLPELVLIAAAVVATFVLVARERPRPGQVPQNVR